MRVKTPNDPQVNIQWFVGEDGGLGSVTLLGQNRQKMIDCAALLATMAFAYATHGEETFDLTRFYELSDSVETWKESTP